jgi:hypothetical protein
MAIDGIYGFHRRAVPLLARLFAEPKLLAAYRKSLIAGKKGPHIPLAALENCIAVEQKLPRIDKHVNASLISSLALTTTAAVPIIRKRLRLINSQQ